MHSKALCCGTCLNYVDQSGLKSSLFRFVSWQRKNIATVETNPCDCCCRFNLIIKWWHVSSTAIVSAVK